MAITATTTPAAERIQMASGSYMDDAGSPAAATIQLGFTPRYVRVEDQTNRILLEWYEGMTDGHAIKTVAAGTRTAETSGGITVNERSMSFPVTQNAQYRWVAFS